MNTFLSRRRPPFGFRFRKKHQVAVAVSVRDLVPQKKVAAPKCVRVRRLAARCGLPPLGDFAHYNVMAGGRRGRFQIDRQQAVNWRNPRRGVHDLALVVTFVIQSWA